MIYGIGTDVIEIPRVQRVLERFGERFAAEEAFTKALGIGIHAPANWHGVWVTNLKAGKPVPAYSPAQATLVEARGIRRAHLTITDERGMAAAPVILECGG